LVSKKLKEWPLALHDDDELYPNILGKLVVPPPAILPAVAG
jgi:hypothetical protein